MAFKLTKQQSGDWTHHERRMRDSHKKLSDSIHSFNSAVKQGHQALQTLADEYNSAMDDAREFVNDIGEEWQTAWDEKSEAWQEGDTGQELSGVIDGMKNYAPENFDLGQYESIDQPSVNEAEEMDGIKPEG